MDFSTQIKKKKPLLKKTHMEAKLKWAKAHKDWTEDDWRRVVFSDETKINVWGSDGCCCKHSYFLYDISYIKINNDTQKIKL